MTLNQSALVELPEKRRGDDCGELDPSSSELIE